MWSCLPGGSHIVVERHIDLLSTGKSHIFPEAGGMSHVVIVNSFISSAGKSHMIIVEGVLLLGVRSGWDLSFVLALIDLRFAFEASSTSKGLGKRKGWSGGGMAMAFQ